MEYKLLTKNNKIISLSFSKTLLASTIITALTTPLLWILSGGNIDWILIANIILFLGVLILFYPFILYVYPYMVTKIGTFLLTSLLIIISMWINFTVISLLLPSNYIYEATLNATIEKFLILGTIYIMAINSLTLPLLYQEKKIENFF